MSRPRFDVIEVDAVTMRLVGELDLETVSSFDEATADMPRDGGLTLDLSELEFIDSMGLHALVSCARKLQVQGRAPLVLARPTSHVAKVLEIVGLDKHEGIAIT
jgi:anti-anti-sigma factor